MNCSKEDRSKCGAFLTHNGPCWAVKGVDTVCASKIVGVFSLYSYGECDSIKNF